MESNTTDEVAKRHSAYLKHLSMLSVYFILFLIGVGEFKVTKAPYLYRRLAVPFVIACIIAIACMAGLSFCDDQATFFNKHRRLLRVGFLASFIVFIFGLAYMTMFFIQL